MSAIAMYTTTTAKVRFRGVSASMLFTSGESKYASATTATEDDDDVRDLCDGDPTECEHLDREVHDREHHQGLKELMLPRAESHGPHGMGAREGYHRLP